MTFHPLTIVTAQAPTNTTSQTIQRGYTAPPALCAGPPSAASISPVRAAKAVSLCLASATALGGTRHTSTAARSRRLLHQSPSPILKQSFSNSNLIGLTLLLVKAVIGPSLSKMSVRIGGSHFYSWRFRRGWLKLSFFFAFSPLEVPSAMPPP